MWRRVRRFFPPPRANFAARPPFRQEMAQRTKAPSGAGRLSTAELGLLERLVEAGALVAKPEQPNAKPRKVIAAALAPDRKRIILWLSRKTTELDGRRGSG